MPDNEPYKDSQKSVEDVALSIDRCRGNYAFLIGAGTSVSAGISTANELIDRWRENEHKKVDPDLPQSEWVGKKEATMAEYQNTYGFWFEERFTTRAERRNFIRDIVEDADPTFEHIVISSLMREGFVPVTLTPNFDNLVYDAFYLYLEERPFLIDHNALAPEFKITSDDPMIVKMHGDYLYDNLKNTGDETNNLEEDIKDVLLTTLNEYGLIVLGYSGRDQSIMSVLNSDDVEIPDPGLYWCTTDTESLSENAKELLEKNNTFLVDINSSVEFFYELYGNLEDINIPTPMDLKAKANDRANSLEQGIINVGGVEVRGLAHEYNRRDEYDNSIDILTEAIEEDGDDRDLISLRAWTYRKIGKKESAINDYERVIEMIDEEIDESNETRNYEELQDKKLGCMNDIGITHTRAGDFEEAIDIYEDIIEQSDRTTHHLNYFEAKLLNDQTEEAVESAEELASGLQSSDDQVNCLMLIIVGKIFLDEEYEQELEQMKDICQDGHHGSWNFVEIRDYLRTQEIVKEKQEQVENIISEYKGGRVPEKLKKAGLLEAKASV